MRLQLTKIFENKKEHAVYAKRTFHLGDNCGVEYVMIDSNHDISHRLWVGRITKNNFHLEDGFILCYSKSLDRLTKNESNIDCCFIGVKETWYKITKKEYDILNKIKTSREFHVITDNFQVVKDLNVNLDEIMNRGE